MLRLVHLRRFLKENKTLIVTPKKAEPLIITDKKELRNMIIATMNEYSNPLVESSSSHEIRNAKR